TATQANVLGLHPSAGQAPLPLRVGATQPAIPRWPGHASACEAAGRRAATLTPTARSPGAFGSVVGAGLPGHGAMASADRARGPPPDKTREDRHVASFCQCDRER